MTTTEIEVRPSTTTWRGFGVVAVLLAGILALQAWQVFGGQSFQRQRWEYTIESPDDNELIGRLDTLGEAGWEIVAARRATSSDPSNKASYEMILKRPKSAVDDVTMPLPIAPK